MVDPVQETNQEPVEPSNPLLEGQDFDSDDSFDDTDGSGEPSSEPSPDPLAAYRELGFQNVETPEEANQRLMQAYRQQMADVEALRRQQEELKTLAQYGNQYLQQLQQPQQQQQTPQQPDSWWSPPQVDTELLSRFRVTDAEGRMQWRQDTPPEIRAQAEAHERYLEQWAERLVREPQKVLPEIIEKEFDRLFEERYSQRVNQEYTSQRLQQIQQENAEWLYEKDPRSGQVARNPDGTYRLTPAGQAALHFANEAETDYGIQDPDKQWDFVMRSLRAYAQPQQQRDPRLDHLQKHSANTPNRSGSVETPEQPVQRRQNTNQSPGETLVELMAANGDL